MIIQNVTTRGAAVEDIDHLDFHGPDNTCYARHGHCPQVAEWSIRLCCLGCGREVHVLFCEPHKRQLVRECQRGRWRDRACTTGARVRLYSVKRLRARVEG